MSLKQFLTETGESYFGQKLLVGLVSSPFIGGYKLGLTSQKLISDPVSDIVPSSYPNDLVISPDQDTIILTHNVTLPAIDVFRRNGSVFESVTSPVSLTAKCYSADFSPNGGYVALTLLGVAGSPYLRVYKIVGTTWTQMTVPNVTAIAHSVVKWSPDSNYLVAVHSGSMSIWKRSGDTFTRVHNEATTISYRDVTWSNDSTYLIVGAYEGTTKYTKLYKRVSDTFSVITGHSSFATLPCQACAFSPDGNFLVIGCTGNRIVIFSRSGETYTQLYDIASGLSETIDDNPGKIKIFWSNDGNYFVVGAYRALNFHIFKRSGTTFTKLDTVSNTSYYCGGFIS